MDRLYLDTNVLFPMTLMDLMLSMAEDFHHDILWTDFLLDEWERVIVREKRRTPDQAGAITAAIRQTFPDGRIVPRRTRRSSTPCQVVTMTTASTEQPPWRAGPRSLLPTTSAISTPRSSLARAVIAQGLVL